MRAIAPWEALLKSLGYLCTFVTDNVVAVASFLMFGLATFVAHKSVVQLRSWGVPSMYIGAMEILHAFVWLTGALAVAWLCTTATIKFCKNVSRG